MNLFLLKPRRDTRGDGNAQKGVRQAIDHHGMLLDADHEYMSKLRTQNLHTQIIILLLFSLWLL